MFALFFRLKPSFISATSFFALAVIMFGSFALLRLVPSYFSHILSYFHGWDYSDGDDDIALESLQTSRKMKNKIIKINEKFNKTFPFIFYFMCCTLFSFEPLQLLFQQLILLCRRLFASPSPSLSIFCVLLNLLFFRAEIQN